MSYPLVLPQEEQRERHAFAGYLWRTFSLSRSSSSQFAGAITAEALLDMYKAYNPSTTLTIDMISHMVTFGGYMNEHGELYLKINQEAFTALPNAAQGKILSYCNYAKSLRLRQIMLGDDAAAVDAGIALDESFRHFTQTQIFNKDFKYWNALPKGQRNTSTNAIYEYYQQWCAAGGYLPRSKKDLMRVLTALNYQIKQGYYQGSCGIRIVANCVIPHTPEEIQMSLESDHLGVLRIQDHFIYNDGIIRESLSEEGLRAYLTHRRCISSVKALEEKEAKEVAEEALTESSNRTGNQVPQHNTDGGTQEILEEEKGETYWPSNAGNEQHTQESPRTSVGSKGSLSNRNLTEIAGFSNPKGISGTIPSDNNSRREPVQYDPAETDFGDESDEGIGSSVSGCDPEVARQTAIKSAVKAFYTGLRVTYRLMPSGTFNYEVFVDELTKASIGNFTEEEKHTLYTDFIKSIKK